MHDLTQAVTFLESLNLAHGDLRPENVLLDRDRLKLSDFDCTAKIGAEFEACMAPYGRILNSSDAEYGTCGTSGFLGPRTEQFALGSIYYLINYGFEVYGDQTLTEDHRERGPRIVHLLQHMEFPNLVGDSSIDDIIHKCWHNKYPTIAELASDTEALLLDCESDAKSERDIEPSWDMTWEENKTLCENLETQGLLDLLSANDPEQLGFACTWYRHRS